MYQPQYQQQQSQQQQTTVVLQPTGPVQPVGYVVHPPAVCEFYDGGQSMVAGIILIIAGVLSIIFNILGQIFYEIMAYAGHGYWCGIMVS